MGWETFDFSDPTVNTTAPPWEHDGSGELARRASVDQHSIHLPTTGEVPVVPEEHEEADTHRLEPILLIGPETDWSTLPDVEAYELSPEAFKGRYGLRVASAEERRIKGGVPPNGEPEEYLVDEAIEARKAFRGEGPPDLWRYPVVETSAGIDATGQLSTLLHAMGQPGQSAAKRKAKTAEARQILCRQLRRYKANRPGRSEEEQLEAYWAYKEALGQGGAEM